jgi:GWxTD domain-containing protein
MANALGWALVHSIWEGAAVALLLALGLCATQSARLRYLAGCTALVTMLAAFFITFACALPSSVNLAMPLPRLAVSAVGGPGLLELLERQPSLAPPWWITPAWLCGVVLFQLRALGGWISVHRMRQAGTLPAPLHWQQRLRDLAPRLLVTRTVALFESCLAEVPVVIGHLRPVILVPLGLLTNMPPEQVEALLTHELAHIRRHDYLVNLVQTFVECLMFYHPAVWWISNRIRAERENCCDDLTVAANGDAYRYAAALAALEINRWSAEKIALAATGGSLMKRVRRLLRQPEGPRADLGPVLAACLLAAGCGMGWMGYQSRLQAAPQEKAESPYTKWMNEDVAYIITGRERAAFQRLGTEAERQEFIEQFWDRRNPAPGSLNNPFKEEHYRRIAYANSRFASQSGLPGWKTGRGRIYITYGPPDEIESHPSGGTYGRPAELWKYHSIPGVGTNVIMEFVDKDRNGEYRMTMDPYANNAKQVVK